VKRSASIEALLKKAKGDFLEVTKAYQASLSEKHVQRGSQGVHQEHLREFALMPRLPGTGHLRDALRRLKETNRLYFPIRSNSWPSS
jgi:hypothetical protein